MKAIVNIKNVSSQYYKYNGLTFTVRDLMHSMAGLVLDKVSLNQTDFCFNEIIIVDLQEEVKHCVKFDFYHKLEKLRTYAKANRIDIDNLIFEYSKP